MALVDTAETGLQSLSTQRELAYMDVTDAERREGTYTTDGLVRVLAYVRDLEAEVAQNRTQLASLTQELTALRRQVQEQDYASQETVGNLAARVDAQAGADRHNAAEARRDLEYRVDDMGRTLDSVRQTAESAERKAEDAYSKAQGRGW